MSFELHPRLASGTVLLGRLPGGLVLLKNNALFPWVLVVPEVEEGIEDLHQLDHATHDAVIRAIRTVSQFVSEHFQPDKLNVACIGNQVRQMHIHVVGRSEGDAAWPGVVWSHPGRQPYAEDQLQAISRAWSEFRSTPGEPG